MSQKDKYINKESSGKVKEESATLTRLLDGGEHDEPE